MDQGKEKTNVLLLTLDAFSYELLTEHVNEFHNISKLINEGTFFTNAFSVGPSTFFAFPAIIGGTYPYHFGIGIDKNIKTIYDILKSNGYNTSIINECNALLTPYYGYCRGVDYQNHFLDLSHAEVDRKLSNVFQSENDGQVASPNRGLRMINNFVKKYEFDWMADIGKPTIHFYNFLKMYYLNKSERYHDREKLYNVFRKDILDFIREKFTSPQFLWIHTIINHLPYLPPEDCSVFNTKEIDYLNCRGLSGLVDDKVCERLKKLYVESMKRTDAFIGDIISALKNKGVLENTMIIVTADHGEEFLEDGYFEHENISSSDRLLHVPLVFYHPGVLKQNKIDLPVSTIDIMPTVCNMMGISTTNSSRGISQEDVITNWPVDEDSYREMKERPLFSEAWYSKGLLDRSPGYESDRVIFTVRKGNYKLKVVRKRRNREVFIDNCTLKNWKENKKLDIENNKHIYEELMFLLYDHIYSERCFARNIRLQAELKQIKNSLHKVKSNSIL